MHIIQFLFLEPADSGGLMNRGQNPDVKNMAAWTIQTEDKVKKCEFDKAGTYNTYQFADGQFVRIPHRAV